MNTAIASTPTAKRRGPRIAVAVAGVLTVTAGALYFTGVYDSWVGKDAAAQPCDGVVPLLQAEKYLGVRGLASDDPWDGDSPRTQQCTVHPRQGESPDYDHEMAVSAGRYESSRSLLLDLDRHFSDGRSNSVSPIGNGWRGVLTTDSREASVTVVMACKGPGQDDLVVNLHTSRPENVARDHTPEQRAQLARLATRTAVNAAERAGCEADQGKTIDKVAAAIPDSFDNTSAIPPGKATGTCEGVPARTRETEADPLAPIEDCFLIDKAGEPAFRLAAYYGPYVVDGHVETYKRGDSGKFRGPAGGSDGLYWASASCPAQGGTAFFTSETLWTGKRHTAEDPALQQSSLRAFAERSAKAHGCGAPEFDGGYR